MQAEVPTGASGAEMGMLAPEGIKQFFGPLESTPFLSGTGRRLVLFCEMGRQPVDLDEFKLVPALPSVLPQRVGLVLSGVPKDIELPTGDPHFLDLPIRENELGDFKGSFLHILNNMDKEREKGFVVVVRKPQSLQVLQALCLDPSQTWNKCLTARYGLESAPVFASLLLAFVGDLQRIKDGRDNFSGHLRPEPSDPLWTLWNELVQEERVMELLAQAEAILAAHERVDLAGYFKSDQPSTEDQLGHGQLVQAVAAFLRDPKTKPPLSIAIDAPWGAGKSSVMEMVRDELQKEVIEKDKEARKRKKGISLVR